MSGAWGDHPHIRAVLAEAAIEVTATRWMPGENPPLDTRPPELWIELVCDAVGGWDE